MQEGFCLVLAELWLVADAGQNSGLFLILYVRCVVLCVCSRLPHGWAAGLDRVP